MKKSSSNLHFPLPYMYFYKPLRVETAVTEKKSVGGPVEFFAKKLGHVKERLSLSSLQFEKPL